MNWEHDFSPDFPIDAISRRALAEGHARRQRRRARRSLAGASLAVLLLAAGMVATMTRDEASQQVTAGPAPVPSLTPRVGNGKIFFVRAVGPGDPSAKLFAMDPDGSGQSLVRDFPAGIDTPAWSPDGTRLVFRVDRDLFVMSADGRTLTQLTTDGSWNSSPTWSPDGARIAYRSLKNGPDGEIRVMKADGSDQQVVATGTGAGEPSWSPTGDQIAYSDGIHGQLWILTLGTPVTSRVVPIDGYASQPAWSPDGARLAYRTEDSISVTALDGTGVKRLVSPPPTAMPTPPGGGTAVGPRWSPDGSKVAYTLLDTGEHCSIWTMNADGTGRRQLTDGASCDRDVAWQPVPWP